jgi:hypothetical protein
MTVRVERETATHRLEVCDQKGTTTTDGALSRCAECGKMWPARFGAGAAEYRLVEAGRKGR